MPRNKTRAWLDGKELERTHTPRQATGLYQRDQGSLRRLIKYALQFAMLALRALAHPDNKRDWRFAYAFFVFPVFYVGGFVLATSLVIGLLLPFPWDWIGVGLWWFYMSGEAFLYITEGDAFGKWLHWTDGSASGGE